MRVLQLGPYPPPHGGVQTNLVAIRSFLLSRGIPCAVINVTRHRRPDADEVYYPKGPAQLLGLLARLKYDLIHQHFGGMLTNRILALSLACTSRPGAKSVMTFHSGGYPSTPEGQALRPNSFAGFVLRRFDGLIAVNGEIMSFFQKMRVLPHRARLISPYSFVTEQSPGSLPEPLAAFFAAHDPVLISAGQLEPEYDLPLQIEAMPHIREKFPDAGLVMLGSGSLNEDLGARIQRSLVRNISCCQAMSPTPPPWKPCPARASCCARRSMTATPSPSAKPCKWGHPSSPPTTPCAPRA